VLHNIVSLRRIETSKEIEQIIELTLIVLLHVEPPQQHDRLLTEQTSIDRVRRINTLVHVNRHDTASAAETIVETAKVDATNTVLAER